MGKKFHNVKARQNVKTIIDKTPEKQIKVELNESSEYGGYDDANAFVLPSKKRETKQQKEKHTTTRILSKKQRKKLEKIVDKKAKKEGRSSLIEALASVQIPKEELQKYTSISQVQTIGLKNFKKLDNILQKVRKHATDDEDKTPRISSIAGIKKRKRLALLQGYNEADSSGDENSKSKKPKDLNVIGLDDETDYSESDNDEKDLNESVANSNKKVEGSSENEINKSTESPVEINTLKINNLEENICQGVLPGRLLNLNQEQTNTGWIEKTIDLNLGNNLSAEHESFGSEEWKEEEIVSNILKASISENKDSDWIEEELNPNKNQDLSLSTVEITKPSEKAQRIPAKFVPVYRDSEIQAARLRLPILAEEQVIMETINENPIVILEGETGSGKTTQVPQFLYEAGYAEKKMIAVTEPRRVAAISMSKRVAKEMNLSEKEVSYLIRFEGNVTDKTKIKFMTDGVLLKEIESDYLLSNYSVIILDEAHERSAYTDILVGLLSRIVPLRNKKNMPLKLIIMSATLRVGDFTKNTKLFSITPPVLKVETRQYKVEVHYQKRTPEDHVKEAYRKAVKIHSQLPEGAILVFLTGQQEIKYIVRKLRKQFPYTEPSSIKKHKNAQKSSTNAQEQEENDTEIEMDMKNALKNIKRAKKRFTSQISLPKINLDDYKLPTDDTDADLLENEDNLYGSDLEIDDEIDHELDDETVGKLTKQPLWVLPLYSLMSTEKQHRIFQPPPEGCRLCVVSTNVAETSLTIPNIKYVVDSGKQKTRLYDVVTGVSSFVVTFISKASADQRAGRAGRVSEGHCYRLYSRAKFGEFEEFAVPDIQKKPIDDLMMQMKSMGIENVVNFPFPSPPDSAQLQMAERRLAILGALEESSVAGKNGTKTVFKVTPLGRAISAFPVAPRFGKMLALSHQQNLLQFTICMVAALSVQQVLIEENDTKDKKSKWYDKRRSWARTGHYKLLGDPWVLIRATGEAEYARSHGKLDKICEDYGVSPKALAEIRKLRIQLTNQINLNISGAELFVDPQMKPPTDVQAKYLRQILLAGMGDQVARKIPKDEIKDKESQRQFKYAYQCPEMEDPVFMHSGSVLKKAQPEWVIYQEAFELENGDSKKTFIRGITAIEPEWLLLYVPKLCNIHTVREDPQPKYKSDDGKVYCYVDATFGRSGWTLPITEIEMPLSEQACKYFGMFLLNGDVCPKLLKYKQKLKATPSSLVKSWSNLNFCVTNFAKALISKQINSKNKLYELWKTEPTYLLQQYSNMLYDVSTAELSVIWPPIEE